MKFDGILQAITMPLHGRHMIEASAGTGKTYNITRIYVRLLVEKKLTVRQILVMTFTEAATEEIKHRIGLFISELITDFTDNPCEFSMSLQAAHGADEMLSILQLAKLELDLASIYTLHGFCQSVIMRYGLSMDSPHGAKLATDFAQVKLHYIADAIRSLRNQPEHFELLQDKNWHDPRTFLSTFKETIGNNKLRSPKSKDTIVSECAGSFNQYWEKTKAHRHKLCDLLSNELTFLCAGLKNGQADKVQNDVNIAIDWLNRSNSIEQNDLSEFIARWVGIGNESKDAIKAADSQLLCPEFKRFFSKARMKNYLASGYNETYELIALANEWINGLIEIGVNAANKDAIKTALNNAQVYKVVAKIIRKLELKLQQHKKRYSVIGFDDLIESVAASLNNNNKRLLSSLREQFPVALVDEFQDTDELQYSILDHLYPKQVSQNLLVMIGDPKQAIYSFRGGDIFTYLKARDNADFVWGMDVNYRSSRRLINTYNRIFHGTDLSQPGKDLFAYSISYPIINAQKNILKVYL